MTKIMPVFVFALCLTLSNYAVAETAVTINSATNESNQKTNDASIQHRSETQDPAELHAQHCVGCHINITDGDGSVIYTRSDRLARNETELMHWVRHFSDGLHLNLNDAELIAMRDLIKNRYYLTDQ